MFFRFSVFALGTLALAFGCLEDPNTSSGSGGSNAMGTGGVSLGGSRSAGGTTDGGAGAMGGAGGSKTSGGSAGIMGGSGGASGEAGADSIEGGGGGSEATDGGGGGSEATGGDAGAGGTGEGGIGGAGGGAEAGAAGAAGAAGSAGAGGEGGAVEIGASDYPFAAGPTDVEQPAGAPANLKVLDWAGFKAAVSYTFDDTNATQIEHYDELNALGVRFTFYLQTNKSEISDPTWVKAYQDGHEIGNHTQHHLEESALNKLAHPEEELTGANAIIQSTIGVTPLTMASPYGHGSYIELAKPYFFINRGITEGLMMPNDAKDPFNVRCSIPPADASLDVLNGYADTARAQGGWRVLLVHGFTAGAMDYAYNPVAFGNFVDSVTHVKDFGDVWIDSVLHVGAYWLGQRAFTAATKTSAGGTTTWKWQLPAHFPRGQYLRVTVDGGTLKQGDTTLEWNPHGFYEVALDYKSLTLSP